MKLSNSYFYTIREDLKDEDSVSSNLLVRSGMIRKISAGIYSYMPLGLKVLKNIEQILREEMNKTGAQELLMPALIPADIYERSGRVKMFGNDVFSTTDRFNRKYILGPTHEELFTIAGTYKVQSYKDLPFNLYQFETKFRDEPRPRYGLIRIREFTMKDAYSFDADFEGLDKSYQIMYNAYCNSFDRMKINYKVVKADTGVMGGLLSEEYQAITDTGEDTLVLCDKCDYASNIEVSECVTEDINNKQELLPVEELHTPNVGKIEDLVNNYNLDVKDMVKSIIYKIDNEFIMVMVRSDDEVNETKLKILLDAKAKNFTLADNEDVEKITGAKVGFAGPIKIGIKIIADNRVKNMNNFLVGANKTDYHFINVNFDRDFRVDMYADIRNTKEGDACPKCGGKLYFKKGIEIGNIFKLGTKYSDALGLNYLDQNQKLNSVVMGSYGIGLGRCMASIVEQNNDEKGIVWPISVAPYKVCIILIDVNDTKQAEIGNYLYDKLNELKIGVILDDREERPGVKFNDMDLIGIPVRITVGKKANENIVECKLRNSNDVEEIDLNDIINKIEEKLKDVR